MGCDPVSTEEMKEEIMDMLSVCFEGKVAAAGSKIFLTLPDGQRFCLNVEEG